MIILNYKINLTYWFILRYDDASSTLPPTSPFLKTMLRHKIFAVSFFFYINFAFLHNFYIGTLSFATMTSNFHVDKN